LRRRLVSILVLLQSLALASPAPAQQTVQIDAGRLKGFVSQGVLSFKGIPYAAPPLGRLRWREPRPPAKWKGIRAATEYGHDCMQLPFPSDAAPLGTTPSEDCLVMNVWAPEPRPAGKLPVMVWIYGGGWVNGGSSPAVYDGSPFARDGIVFVSFNYRLGRFGFFAHPALTKENPDGLLGNYGYMDQIAALKWVQRNIAAFGGDPGNVTLFGESAGGFAVHALLTTPRTEGLFQRAIIESGGGRSSGPEGAVWIHDAVRGKPSGPSAESLGSAFARGKGIQGDDAAALARLRDLPAADIVDGLNMASTTQAAGTYSGPMIDGKIVVEDLALAYRDGKQHHVPVIVGANSMDIGFSTARTAEELFAPFGSHAKQARQVYDPDTGDPGHAGDLRLLSMQVAADAFMVEPARFVARTLSSAGQPVWEYRFSYVAESMRKQWPGAAHASEIPYVFDTVKSRYGATLTPVDEQAARAIHRYWVQFARTGDPNGGGLAHWPAYHAQSDELMDFTNSGPTGEADPWKLRLDMTEGVAALPSSSSAP